MWASVSRPPVLVGVTVDLDVDCVVRRLSFEESHCKILYMLSFYGVVARTGRGGAGLLTDRPGCVLQASKIGGPSRDGGAVCGCLLADWLAADSLESWMRQIPFNVLTYEAIVKTALDVSA